MNQDIGTCSLGRVVSLRGIACTSVRAWIGACQ